MRLLKPLLAAACLLATNAHAVSYTLNFVESDWLAGVGSSTQQDFSGYAANTSVKGLEVLPSLTLDTNLPNLEVRPESDVFASGAGAGSRADGNAYYEFTVNNAYQALAIEIGAYESAQPPFNVAGGAVTRGTMEVLFQDGTTIGFMLDATDGVANVFFGLRANTPITRVRWLEGLEAGGLNEETTIERLRVAQAVVNRVPEPSSLLLAGGALALLARRRTRG